MEQKIFSVAEAQAFLGVSRSTIYNLIHRADFPTSRIGRRIVIPRDALEKWLANGGTEPRDAI